MTAHNEMLEAVIAMDDADSLRPLRDRYIVPEGVIYLDGNSLGVASPHVLAELERAARDEWSQGLIRSWNDADWFNMPSEVGDQIGRLIGAAPGQTIVADTTSTNIYKALNAALDLNPKRGVIVSEAGSFPTDVYMAQGVASVRSGVSIRLEGIDAPAIEDLIDETTSVVLVNHVNYKTGALRDMAALTALAHEKGALVVWDLCHSAGALPVDLDGCNADFAVGCTYKYLNGGPGAPAFIYVAERHLGQASQPLSGWWGHARPFAFESAYEGDAGIRRFQCGTQPILSLRALKAALELWEDVDMAALRRKSGQLTGLFIELVEARCGAYGLVLETPREPDARGSQVSFFHEHAYEIVQALIERGVIGDFRAPNTMRFGFTPLYVGFEDVLRAVEALEDILVTEAWRAPQFATRAAVT